MATLTLKVTDNLTPVLTDIRERLERADAHDGRLPGWMGIALENLVERRADYAAIGKADGVTITIDPTANLLHLRDALARIVPDAEGAAS